MAARRSERGLTHVRREVAVETRRRLQSTLVQLALVTASAFDCGMVRTQVSDPVVGVANIFESGINRAVAVTRSGGSYLSTASWPAWVQGPWLVGDRVFGGMMRAAQGQAPQEQGPAASDPRPHR